VGPSWPGTKARQRSQRPLDINVWFTASEPTSKRSSTARCGHTEHSERANSASEPTFVTTSQEITY
jgi:hypothetical protein